jgi:hypothetical protein
MRMNVRPLLSALLGAMLAAAGQVLSLSLPLIVTR